jgi:hypothetical protein
MSCALPGTVPLETHQREASEYPGDLSDGEGTIVTRKDIVTSGARTLWEVLRSCTHLQLSENQASESPWIRVRHRGSMSLFLDNTPLVFLDGARVGDFYSLSQIRAEDIAAIRILSSAQAANRFGFGANNGVIEVFMRRR